MTKIFQTIGRRDLRLASGLVLFTYLTAHLINHSLGLISFEVAEAGLRLVVAFWHSAPGTVLLYGAAMTHVALALHAVYERRTLRMPPLQTLRIVMGLWMPVVLITHFTGTRVAFERLGQASDYTRVVAALWTPEGQGRQLALLVPGWIHGCLGLKFAFGGKKWFRRMLPLLFGASILLPVLAGLGFLEMGRALTHEQAKVSPELAASQLFDNLPELVTVRDALLVMYSCAIALMLAARQLRWIVERQRKGLITIAYPGRRVQVPRGWSVLEASRSFGIPHLSLCGGNARCSTCRVRITSGADRCPPPSTAEQQLLARTRATDDMRLACQLRPRGDVGVAPLLTVVPDALGRIERPQQMFERKVAILVTDLRRSESSTSTQTSAHDKAYALNLFHEAFGDAVLAAGGTPCGYADHEVVAVFGLTVDLTTACKQALKALALIEGAARQLNARLSNDLGAVVEVVMAVHAGSVVMAQMGHRNAKTLAPIGSAVDITRRLRDCARDYQLGCVMSQTLLQQVYGTGASMTWRDAGLDEHGKALRVCADASSEACLRGMPAESLSSV